MRTIPALFLLTFLLAVPALAQSTSSTATTPPFPPVRDAKAVAAVQAAITAFGSSATAQSLEAQAQVQAPDPNGNQTASTVTWEMAGAEFRIATSDGAVVVTGYGNPAAIMNGTLHPVPKHVTEAMFIPAFPGAILAREFQDQSYSLQYMGTPTLNGVACAVVQTVSTSAPNAPLTAQTWFFSTATNLPVRVTYRSPADATPQLSVPETVDLSNYTAVSGGLYPFAITVHFLGKQVAVITLQSVEPNANVPSTDFDSPAGGAQ